MAQKLPQPKDLFITATSFWKANKLVNSYTSTNKDFDMLSSLFVNLSFAGELYLKCLLLIRTGTLHKGHDLKELFYKLPDRDKSDIQDAYDNEINKSVIVQAMKSNNPGVDLRLPILLLATRRTFEKWRYSYEAEPNATFTLNNLVDVIQKHLLKIDSELNKALHVPLTS